MAINLNRQPYFDDFDKNNNFVKVLFKPSRPVQVRELNQAQSIQQHQLELLANHLFKDGAKIEGRAPRRSVTNFITINSTSPTIKNLLIPGAILRGSETGIEATILHVVDEVSDISPATIYINYTKTGTDTVSNLFIDNELLYILDNNVEVYENVITVRDATNTVNTEYLKYPIRGKAVIWKISESIFYSHGYFVEIQPSFVIGEAYSLDSESYSIGFDVQEEIIDTYDPTYGDTLFDNALGYPNYAAPGADRLKLNLTLIKQPLDTAQTDNFILLVKVEDGITTYVKTRTDYNTIMETLAERTYDESGNYSVSPISIKFRDHLKKDEYDSYGLFYARNLGDPNDIDGARIFGDEDKFVAVISPIKAYIKGFLVETIAESKIELTKSRDLASIKEFYDRFNTLNYILIELDDTSALSPNALNDTSIFTNKAATLTDAYPVDNAPAGDDIGTITVYDIEYDSIVNGHTFYRLYFTDLVLTDGYTVDDIKSIYKTDETYFLATLLLAPFSIFNNNQKTLICELGKSSVYSIKNVLDSTNGLDYTIKRRLTSTVIGTSLTFNAINGEIFDDYNPVSSFIQIIDHVTGAKIANIAFTDTNFLTESTLVITFDDNAYDGKYAILYQKTIKRNNAPKIKYLKTNEIMTGCSITAEGLITLTNKTDLISITSVIRTADVDEYNVLDNFLVFDGQTDTAYLPISLLCNNATYLSSINTGVDTFKVTFTYYTHSSSGDYFSIDSYRNIIDDPNISYGYEDVPNYISSDSTRYILSDCLDFRPDILSSNKIQLNRPALNGLFNCDISYYLPRIDYIVINQTGKIYQKLGHSSETPRPPILEADNSEMAIMLLKMKPYIYNVRTDVIKTAIDNKRYTMRDIGKLEKRIENLEYYTSFTLLEMQTETASIKDAEGIDRYKNGFIADNFQNFQIADIQSSEFRAAHDKRYQELRPAAFPYNTDLVFNAESSQNYIQIGNKIIIDYDEESYIEQPFASKSISLNPYFIFERKGIMKLFPDSDNWVDTNFIPELSVTIDTGIDLLMPAEPLIETSWGSWNTMSETNVSSTTTALVTTTRSVTEVTTNTEINVKSQQQTGLETTTTFDTRVDQHDLGVRITDAELMTYARSTITAFVAGNLKPNTKVYAFFDDMPVSSYCAPWRIDAQYGDPLVSDDGGNLIGIFEIPENTFFTGQKIFRLTNEINNDQDQDTLLTSAEAKFWSGGLALTKQGTTLNVNAIEMSINEETLTQNRVVVSAESTINSRIIRTMDPLAQTFYNEISCFVTSFDVYFDQVGVNDKIWVELKNTENGYPGTIIYGETILDGALITTSTDASVLTNITFPFPVFIEGGKEYALVIGAFSPDTRIYCSLLGKTDLTNPSLLISTQTSMGTLFKGQNNTTWTASQYEDMKITLYRAHFKYDYLLAVLENDISKENIIALNPFETEDTSQKIRIYARNHGLTANDKIKFHLHEKTIITLTQILNEAPIINVGIGQIIKAYDNNDVLTGQAIIYSKEIISTDVIKCELTDIQGSFTENHYIETTILNRDMANSDKEIIAYINTTEIVPLYHPQLKATITQLRTAEYVPISNTITNVNGIPAIAFDSTLTVDSVDSIDTFIVDAGYVATSTGKAGGNVKFDINRRYELFNTNGAYSAIDCSENWMYYGIGQENNDLFVNDNYRNLEGKRFTPYTDVFLKQPYKFANELNETSFVNGKNITITGEFQTNTKYASPVLDIGTFNTIMVSNRVDFVDDVEMDIAPNAIGRYIDELDPVMGSEVFKYVSKNITLRNSALDLKIFVDVYKPIYTDFDIYLKIQPTWDYTSIEIKPWIKIDPVWKDFTSRDLTDYREVQILTNEIMPTVFGITGSIGEFSSFKVKIVGRARNSANPPLFRRLRAIALT